VNRPAPRCIRQMRIAHPFLSFALVFLSSIFTGGDSNIFSLTQSTWGKQMLRAAGVDPDELKME